MKKTVISVVLIVLIVFSVSAGGSKEKNYSVNLGVMQGPTGFSSSALDEFVSVSVFSTPAEALSRLINGELDAAALPANAAATLFNKGQDIRILAVIGEGMLSIIGTNEDAFVLHVPGAGAAPDHMAQLLYPSLERDYSITAPAQLAQMAAAGKIEKAILPQPFVNMVLSKNGNVKILSNVQEKWEEVTGDENFPMSVLVTTASYAEQNASVIKALKKSYRKSIEKITEDPAYGGKRIEELGIMSASLAEASIKDCALVFKDIKDASEELEKYYQVLFLLAPDAIGGKVPSKELYGL